MTQKSEPTMESLDTNGLFFLGPTMSITKRDICLVLKPKLISNFFFISYDLKNKREDSLPFYLNFY